MNSRMKGKLWNIYTKPLGELHLPADGDQPPGENNVSSDDGTL